MIKYHNIDSSTIVAEISEADLIKSPDDMLDIMAETGYNNCSGIIIHVKSLRKDFFDLKTGLAGEILQMPKGFIVLICSFALRNCAGICGC
jgi:hypothetical protein